MTDKDDLLQRLREAEDEIERLRAQLDDIESATRAETELAAFTLPTEFAGKLVRLVVDEG